jgi:hypothetical protein
VIPAVSDGAMGEKGLQGKIAIANAKNDISEGVMDSCRNPANLIVDCVVLSHQGKSLLSCAPVLPLAARSDRRTRLSGRILLRGVASLGGARLEGASHERHRIEVIGRAPWGTHFCQFYETAQDLVDILV